MNLSMMYQMEGSSHRSVPGEQQSAKEREDLILSFNTFIFAFTIVTAEKNAWCGTKFSRDYPEVCMTQAF